MTFLMRNVHVEHVKGSLASNAQTDAVHLSDLKRRRYWFPLMV
jgi:hypothetical protein